LNHFLQQIEAALLPTAIKYAPEGAIGFALREKMMPTLWII
jgi:hypothetical protein